MKEFAELADGARAISTLDDRDPVFPPHYQQLIRNLRAAINQYDLDQQAVKHRKSDLYKKRIR